ncbi:MAG: hypothetical protein ACRDPY_00435 [Streptosporangiaceae bacterium]
MRPQDRDPRPGKAPGGPVGEPLLDVKASLVGATATEDHDAGRADADRLDRGHRGIPG